MSINNEVDTKDIILDAFKNNKKVAIPKIINGNMENLIHLKDNYLDKKILS